MTNLFSDHEKEYLAFIIKTALANKTKLTILLTRAVA